MEQIFVDRNVMYREDWIQEAIQTKSLDILNEKIEEWYNVFEEDTFDYMPKSEFDRVRGEILDNTPSMIFNYTIPTLSGLDLNTDTIYHYFRLDNQNLMVNIEQMVDNENLNNLTSLKVYFKLKLSNDILECLFNSESIEIKDYLSIGIVDTDNGTGDFTTLKIDRPVRLDFDISNLMVEKEDRYNLTYDICGLVQDWCEDSKIIFR